MIAIIRIAMRTLPSMPALLFTDVLLHRRNIVTIVASVVLLTKIKKSHSVQYLWPKPVNNVLRCKDSTNFAILQKLTTLSNSTCSTRGIRRSKWPWVYDGISQLNFYSFRNSVILHLCCKLSLTTLSIFGEQQNWCYLCIVKHY